jgi:hypothetical protein
MERTRMATLDNAYTADPQQWRPARWVPLLFGFAAFILLPWTVLLAVSLPSTHAASHWDLTWTGFDALLAVQLIFVAIAALRRSPWLEGAATAAASLLVVDAWFDITTSSSRLELAASIAEAVCVELPVAGVCLLLARNAERVFARSVPSATAHGS